MQLTLWTKVLGEAVTFVLTGEFHRICAMEKAQIADLKYSLLTTSETRSPSSENRDIWP
jgi:hypothetical protein